MLAHRTDHLLLADRVFGGVGEEGDIGPALARLLDTDRELDIEGVGQVVDDHADDAGLCAAQESPRRDGRCSRVRSWRPRRVRVSSSATRELPPRTRETVDFETPARRATSTIVARPSRPSISLCVSSFIVALARSNHCGFGRLSISAEKHELLSLHLERANSNSRPLSSRQPLSQATPLSATIPQTILDALTDIEMPRLTTERPAKETVAARGFSIPLHRSEALVLGSGAAGLRAAVEMKRRDLDVVVVTQSAFGGTSACSGSDKQTLHTANGAGPGRRLRGDGRRAWRRRRDGRGHGLYRSGGFAPRAVVPAVHGAADPAGPPRGRAALSDRP